MLTHCGETVKGKLGIDNNCIMCDFWKKKKQLYNLRKIVTLIIMLIVGGTMNCDLNLFGVCYVICF